jgi:beta-glucosidase-like glycosyl hydrolase
MQKKPLIFGISGPILTQQEKEFLSSHPISGFILFKRNIVSTAQLISLITELKNLYSNYKPIIFIDQEGGRVARLQPPIIDTKYPAAEYFAKLYHHDKTLALKTVRANYTILMQDLKRLGIDSPCAPVADLRYPYTDAVIGDRSFGSDVQQLVDLCSAAIDGIASAGGMAIIKHIPGHGRATCDSHQELPIVTTTLKDLINTDFAVFQQLSKHPKIEWAMTAHIIFHALDPKTPVTLSSTAIKFIKQEIGFTGKLVSDDICMFALHSHLGINQTLTHKNLEELTHEQHKHLYQIFINSLIEVTHQSFAAGCHFVLHGSGHLPEMIAIYDAI